MKNIILFGILILLCLFPLAAQDEAGSLDWDIDTIFNINPEVETKDSTTSEPVVKTPPVAAPPAQAPMLLKRRGITFDASFQFVGSVSPGYIDPPWFREDDDEFSWEQKIKLRADYTIDAQISQIFRVKSVLYFELPKFSMKLGDFFFDYTLYDSIFIRAGKYNLSWGISPNFEFTNLLARIPGGDYHKADAYRNYYNGDSFIVRADVPVGIGGFQFLAISRANLLYSDVMPGWLHIGYGAKYNLALRWADFDLGFLYHDYMPFRAFLSIKTTIGNTELYNEWLAVDIQRPEDTSGALSIGFIHEFFNKKLRVNGEFFYNAEKGAEWYRPETIIREAETSPFVEGPNFALNLLYRFGGKGNPRVFIQSLYAPLDESARVTPGFRLTPWPNIDFYIAAPLDLGVQDGYYYTHPEDTTDTRHFRLVMLITIKGSARAAYYN